VYATAEVSTEGAARPVQRAEAEIVAIAPALAEVATALPPRDRDRDEIPDKEDRCPDQPGGPGDAQHHGCPKAVERVVVLPDEDGHVGGIEVTDVRTGNVVAVLDKPYATAEVATTGPPRPLVSDHVEVAKTFAPVIAARPTGKRIEVLFDEASRPLESLDSAIQAIIEETKQRGNFVVDVVGHTDRVGSRNSNVKLARARARVLYERMIAAGMDKSRIKLISKGELDPIIRTQDEVAEPRNRRVEVHIRIVGAGNR